MENITDNITDKLTGEFRNREHETHSSSSVIEINRRHVFSLGEAREVLPVIFRITKTYCQKVDLLIERLDALNSSNAGASEDLANSIEAQVNSSIQEWQTKVQKLGALPKGLWIADFDAGDGYFCWKFPERSIEFWHRYNDGFSKRIHVSDRCQHISLQDRIKKKILSLTPQIASSILQPTEVRD